MKDEFRKAVYRIISDKYRKTVSKEGLNKEQWAEFISKLNAYLIG